MVTTIGTLTIENVPTRELARIASALDVLASPYTLYFKGWSATRTGEICATQTSWHQLFVPKGITERRQFFTALIDGEQVEVRPEAGIFAELKIEFSR